MTTGPPDNEWTSDIDWEQPEQHASVFPAGSDHKIPSLSLSLSEYTATELVVRLSICNTFNFNKISLKIQDFPKICSKFLQFFLQVFEIFQTIKFIQFWHYKKTDFFFLNFKIVQFLTKIYPNKIKEGSNLRNATYSRFQHFLFLIVVIVLVWGGGVSRRAQKRSRILFTP